MLDSVAQKPAASVFLGTYHVPAPEALPAIDAARHPSLERLSTPERIRAEQEPLLLSDWT